MFKRCIEYFSLYICNFLKNKNRTTNLLFVPYDKETLFLYSDLQIVMQYTPRKLSFSTFYAIWYIVSRKREILLPYLDIWFCKMRTIKYIDTILCVDVQAYNSTLKFILMTQHRKKNYWTYWFSFSGCIKAWNGSLANWRVGDLSMT